MGCPNDIYVIAVMQSARHHTSMSEEELNIIQDIEFEIDKHITVTECTHNGTD